MNWQEAIDGIDRGEADYACGEPFAEALDLPYWYHEGFAERVTKHWVTSWVCTDTRVGLAVYLLDGEPVAIGKQAARKAREEIQFISQAAADRMRDLIKSLTHEETAVTVLELQAEIPASWFDHPTRDTAYKEERNV